MKNTAFVFPGQGAQRVGMCSSFMDSEIIDEIEDSVSMDIRSLINSGPIEALTLTQNAQICIFAASMAVFNSLAPSCVKYMAGHSLGEYTALCACGIVSVPDASRAIKARGELMANSASGNDFGMAAIIGLDVGEVEKLIENEACVIANDNSKFQVVISGYINAVNTISQKALKRGAKKVVKLNTSGPFHSPLMKPAVPALDKIIRSINIRQNGFTTVIMNINASPFDGNYQSIVNQVTSRVRWRETIEYMVNDGVERIVEIGPGRILTGLSKRDYPDVEMFSIETREELESIAA